MVTIINSECWRTTWLAARSRPNHPKASELLRVEVSFGLCFEFDIFENDDKEIAYLDDDVKYVEAERFGAVRLLQEEMVRESPPLPERDDSPPPLRAGHNGGRI